MTRPTLSVVMPNYNHARYLPTAIEELLTQSRPPDELLVLDDASTDNSLEVLRELAARHRVIRVISLERNSGVLAAHRRLFAEARGDYLYAGAADDHRLPGFFAAAMEWAERHPEAGAIFGDFAMIDEQRRPLGVSSIAAWTEPQYVAPERLRREYLERESPGHSPSAATIYRRDALLEVGWREESLGSWIDTFAFQAIALKYGACYIPQTFVQWRRMAGSFSDAHRSDPASLLRIVRAAQREMRLPEFRERFPEPYVRDWGRRFRHHAIWNYWWGDETGRPPPRPPFWRRNLARLLRAPRALWLLTR